MKIRRHLTQPKFAVQSSCGGMGVCTDEGSPVEALNDKPPQQK